MTLRNALNLLVVTGLLSCTNGSKVETVTSESDNETMYQVATLQALLDGEYDGLITVNELRKHGDTGLGTFDKIDGEMIIVDGTVYQARYDGTVSVADDSLTVPFANITHFDSDITVPLKQVKSMEDLTEQITKAITPHGLNHIYAVRIDIPQCDSVLFRSELPQQKPYRPLAEVLQNDQREFSCQGIGGTIVALYFPDFFDKHNSPGWHCHFISDDKSKGGHMFNIAISKEVEAHVDATPYYNLYLP